MFLIYFANLLETEEELQVLQINKKTIIENEIKMPKIMNPSKSTRVSNKENEDFKENKNIEKKGFSHSENLKKNIENKLNEMKIYENKYNCETKTNENFDFNQSKKKALEEKMKNYTSNIKSLKMNTIGFSKSLVLVTGLIKDLDEKMHRIRNLKPKKII